jgi:hypothetical protein
MTRQASSRGTRDGAPRSHEAPPPAPPPGYKVVYEKPAGAPSHFKDGERRWWWLVEDLPPGGDAESDNSESESNPEDLDEVYSVNSGGATDWATPAGASRSEASRPRDAAAMPSTGQKVSLLQFNLLVLPIRNRRVTVLPRCKFNDQVIPRCQGPGEAAAGSEPNLQVESDAPVPPPGYKVVYQKPRGHRDGARRWWLVEVVDLVESDSDHSEQRDSESESDPPSTVTAHDAATTMTVTAHDAATTTTEPHDAATVLDASGRMMGLPGDLMMEVVSFFCWRDTWLQYGIGTQAPKEHKRLCRVNVLFRQLLLDAYIAQLNVLYADSDMDWGSLHILQSSREALGLYHAAVFGPPTLQEFRDCLETSGSRRPISIDDRFRGLAPLLRPPRCPTPPPRRPAWTAHDWEPWVPESDNSWGRSHSASHDIRGRGNCRMDYWIELQFMSGPERERQRQRELKRLRETREVEQLNAQLETPSRGPSRAL